MYLTVPNMLTFARLLMVPAFIAVFYMPFRFVELHQQNAIATAIFAVAGITDWLDGYLARKLNQTSAFGAFLDPVADKFMVASALVVLVQLGRIDASIAIIIIGREIAISALREWMAKMGAASAVAVSHSGKVKTTAQMLAIPFLLSQSSGWLYNTGYVLIIVAAVMTIISMCTYLRSAAIAIKAISRPPLPLPQSTKIHIAKA